jgi:hypothetical protein
MKKMQILEEIDQLKGQKLMVGGNGRLLTAFLRKELQTKEISIAFFGAHLLHDVYETNMLNKRLKLGG